MSKIINCGLGRTLLTGTQGLHKRKKAICETCNPKKDKTLKNVWFKVELSNLVNEVIKHDDCRSYWICANCESLKIAKDYTWDKERIEKNIQELEQIDADIKSGKINFKEIEEKISKISKENQ